MNPGDIVLAHLAEAAPGPSKLRPALLLVMLPGSYQTLLLCGISTSLRNVLANWDETIQPGDSDFGSSGLHRASVIRLGYLQSATLADVQGPIGRIDPGRLNRLRTRLADHTRP
jgi:mRNA interferase MazF